MPVAVAGTEDLRTDDTGRDRPAALETDWEPREPDYSVLPFLPSDIPNDQQQDATVLYKEWINEDRQEEARAALADALNLGEEASWSTISQVLSEDIDGVDATDTAAVRDGLQAAKDPGSGVVSAVPEQEEYLFLRGTRPEPHGIILGLEMENRFMFWPGMYLTLYYDDRSRVYSIASSPHYDVADAAGDVVELAIRRVEGGVLTPRLCDDLSAGDCVHVRGPYLQGPGGSEFVFDDTSERDLVFIATGTGDAPLKGMIDFVYDTGLDEFGGDRDIWFFVGSRWEDDLPYHHALQELDDRYANMHYVPALSGEHYLTDWAGETDYVQLSFLKYLNEAAAASVLQQDVDAELKEVVRADPPYETGARIDPGEIDVYACGILEMVDGITETLQMIGVPAYRIEEEGW